MSDATIAAATGIPIDFVAAIRAVESGKGGPSAVRFEPNKFWRIVKHLPGNATGPQIRAALTPADLAAVPYTPCNLSWRTANGLPPCRHDRAASEVSAETNRAAFERAFRVDPRAAVDASSWGSFQTLTFGLLDLWPRKTPAEAVAAFDASPAEASEAMLIGWLRQNPVALQAAQRRDVFNFVCRYNGCGCHTPYGCAGYKRDFEAALAHPQGGGGGGGGLVGLLLAAAGAYGLWKWLGVVAIVLLVGCQGTTPVQQQAQAIDVAALAVGGAARIVADVALHDAQTTCPEGSDPSCLDPVQARWAPIDATIDSLRTALGAWLLADRIAHQANTDPLAAALGAIGDVVRLYGELRAALDAVHDVTLPDLPAAVLALLPGATSGGATP